MGTKKLLASILALCLMLGCLSVVAMAREMAVPEMGLDEAVRFTVTQDTHVVNYGFTAEEAGTYVLYDVDGGYQTSHLEVEQLSLEREAIFVAGGIGRVAFEAEAGSTYRFTLDCAWVENASIEFEFVLSRASEVESIGIGDATLEQGYVGQTGELSLVYSPLDSASQIVWSTSDPNVLTVTGDQGGAEYQLVGPGTAMVIATTDDGLTAQFEVTVKDVDVLQLGKSMEYTVQANGGRYAELEHDFSFTPAESGSYALVVDHDESLDVYHDLQMSTVSGTGYVYGDEVLRFYAEAGQTCYLNVEFWGMYDQSVVYTFLVEPCVSPEQILLLPEATEGYVDSTVDVRVRWDPRNSLPEALTWICSDESIVRITDPSEEYAVLELLSPGTATITASTPGGITDSFQITVYEPPTPIALVLEQPNPVMLLGGGFVEISFTPEVTAYYRITTDAPDLDAYLYADSTNNERATLYYLEAGETYYGGVDNYADAMVSGDLYIVQDQILMPIGMEITGLPNNTTYLKDALPDMWTYQLLAGLEMDILWSDGTTTAWSFDEEGPYVGYEYLDWELIQGGAEDQIVLRLECNGASASCQLTVLDKSIVGIELVDDSPLQVVEHSCGMDMGDGSWYYSPYLSNIRWVKILFSDGSSVITRPDEQVYGYYVTCEDSQTDAPWVKGGSASVTYSYGGHTVELDVQIVESPVASIELIQMPRDTFILGDGAFFTGESAYYFSPNDLRGYIEGLSLVIWYQDGSSKTVTEADLEWERIMGVEYPCVDGYPLGLFGELMMSNELITGPCEREGVIEYKGASVTYMIQLVEGEVVEPPVDPDPPVDPIQPTDPSETEPSTDPQDPTQTEPSTEPSTEPEDPTHPEGPTRPEDPTESETTDPSTETEPTGSASGDEDGDKIAVVIAVVVVIVVLAAAATIVVLILRKKKAS